MPTIKVAKPFIHTTESGKRHYSLGEHDVDDDVAEDWYVKAHLEGAPTPAPARGSMQYAQAMLNTEQAVRRNLPTAQISQPPAPLPPDVVQVASRSGMVPEGAHYFAGGPQEDKPLPGQGDTAPQVSFFGTP
jgi:hypothetical protein